MFDTRGAESGQNMPGKRRISTALCGVEVLVFVLGLF